jgi:NADH-quinone oxidoreductase subunit L
MLLLAGLSVFGWFSVNPFSAHHSWFWAILPPIEEPTLIWLAPVSIGLVLLGGWLGFRLREPAYDKGYVLLSVEYGFLDTIYKYIVINPLLKLAALLNRTDQRAVDGVVNGAGVGTVVLAHLMSLIDRFGVDGIVNGAAWLAGRTGQLLRSVQNGRVQSYITAAVVGLLLVLWWVL